MTVFPISYLIFLFSFLDFNISMRCVNSMDDKRLAKVISVYKKGDKNSISNYRLISILSSFSEVIEKGFFKRLTEYLGKFNLLNHVNLDFVLEALLVYFCFVI